MVNNKVFIAGAGCGDEELITLKLKKIIEKADYIIYDRLVNTNILKYRKKSSKLIYMGKENFEGGKLQEKINEKIVEKVTENCENPKIILRLKGGDPFVFGRGGEEIESILKANEEINEKIKINGKNLKKIDFEVIPGISSAIAVPEYAGIPVTHRGINTSFHIFTGHTKENGQKLDFETIAKLSGTLIFLMGLKNLEKITKNLIKYGKSENTPVAVIKDGTTSNQKTFTGNLKNICEIVKKNNVKSPVIIIIGDVVNLREKMKWFENKKLFGKNILVTRNFDKQENISKKINEYGGNILSLPFIDIEYTNFEMPDLKNFSAILFNSANSVTGFMKKIKDIRVLANVKIGVVGEKTLEEIKKYKIIPDFYPKEYLVEKLALESTKFTKENDKILFVVSNISPVNTKKYSDLYKRNFEKIVVYNTKPVKYENEIIQDYVKKSDILMFLSSSTFENFWKNLENKNLLNEKIIASIGPVTTKTIEKYGVKVQIEAKKYTEDNLFSEILSKF